MNEFIERYESRTRPAEHFNLAPTFYRESLGCPVNDRDVSILVFCWLLYQRLWQFNQPQSNLGARGDDVGQIGRASDTSRCVQQPSLRYFCGSQYVGCMEELDNGVQRSMFR